MFFRSLHDVKATEMGGQVKFKAEIDFDGREITRAYLYKLDLEQLLKVGCREMYAHVCISADFPGLVQDLTIKNGRVKIVLWA